MKICFYSCQAFEQPYYVRQFTEGENAPLFYEQSLQLNTVSLAEGCDGIAAFVNDDLSQPVLEALKAIGIQYIAMRCAGYDNVDLKAAKALGIRVANVPAYSPYSIAEHAVTLMMALNRRIIPTYLKMKAYDFSLSGLTGFDMNGKTVGLIGTGNIGAITAKILNGLGCHILAYDIEENPVLTQAYGVHYVSLEELYTKSDIISLHCPAVEATKGMINKESIAKMKQGVMLINTARGVLIHTSEVLDAIKAGQVGYLGMDVYEYEKPLYFLDRSNNPNTDPLLDELLTLPNVLVTDHLGFLTENALNNIATTTLENLRLFAKGAVNERELGG